MLRPSLQMTSVKICHVLLNYHIYKNNYSHDVEFSSFIVFECNTRNRRYFLLVKSTSVRSSYLEKDECFQPKSKHPVNQGKSSGTV